VTKDCLDLLGFQELQDCLAFQVLEAHLDNKAVRVVRVLLAQLEVSGLLDHQVLLACLAQWVYLDDLDHQATEDWMDQVAFQVDMPVST
jgi:hypothetical protein